VLLLLDAASGRVAPLARNRGWREHWATWSPDGQRVAYAFQSGASPKAKRGIAEVEVASGARRVVSPEGEGFVFFRPEYAPDGRSLLTQRRGAALDSYSELWLLAEGSPPRALPGRFPRFAEKGRYTRDGEWIVYTGRESAEGPGTLTLARPDGSAARPLAAQPGADQDSARPSPARDEVVFVSARDGNADLFLVDLAGGAAKNLTRTPERNESAPQWSPNGERIAFLAQPAGGPGAPAEPQERIGVIDREGAPLLDTPGSMPDWMPPWPDR
jgi:Tol biopolymer transport system component